MSSDPFQYIYASVKGQTLLGEESCRLLYDMVTSCPDGEVWEVGVYRGGSARFLRQSVPDRTLRLFDTFNGLPKPSAVDRHTQGEFKASEADLGLGGEGVYVYKGVAPETFLGLEDCQIAFLHLDVDLYSSVMNCLEWCYHRMVKGGVIVIDDYGFESCPGAKVATDDFFHRKETVDAIETGQAVIRVDRCQ